MTAVSSPNRVDLVGSIGLDTVEDVFRTAGAPVGSHLRRIPDAEVGGRKLWIGWQMSSLKTHAAVCAGEPGGGR